MGRYHAPKALRSAGAIVHVHDDLFPQYTKDVDWIDPVAKNGWVILTRDESLAKNLDERERIRHSKARVFVLITKNISGQERATAFVLALPAMTHFLRTKRGPFIAKVYKDGSVIGWKWEHDL